MRFPLLLMAFGLAGCDDPAAGHRIEQHEQRDSGCPSIGILPDTSMNGSYLFELFETVLAGPPGTRHLVPASRDTWDLTGSPLWQVDKVDDGICVALGDATLCSDGPPTGDTAIWTWSRVLGDSPELWEIEIDGPAGTVSVFQPDTEFIPDLQTWNGASVVFDPLTPPELIDGLAALVIDMGTRDGDCHWADTAAAYFTAHVCVQTADPAGVWSPAHAAWQDTCVDTPPNCL